jgi:hypothetical protein
MFVTYFSTALGLTLRASTIPLFERFGHEPQHVELARGEAFKRIVAAAQEQLGDHLGIEGCTPSCHPPQRVEEVRHMCDPILEEVPN